MRKFFHPLFLSLLLLLSLAAGLSVSAQREGSIAVLLPDSASSDRWGE
ncbi:MAG: hypothetical protein IPK19_23260 [Chloroflexi bacterium]|nr:hypothetical protein [Chloroflexota bacterium]